MADASTSAGRRLSERQRIAWLRLIRTPNVGPSTFRSLINCYGSADAAIEALPHLARQGGGKPPRVPTVAEAEAEIERAEKAGAVFIAIGEGDYPPMLRQMDMPPPLLAVKGAAAAFKQPPVAIVGARNASLAGMKFARQIASELGRGGYAVVSGLARGIDTAAHEGALDTGTVAVLAGGLDAIYPPEHHDLAERIVGGGGCLISELPPGNRARRGHFVRRNRILAGATAATIVIEASLASGALHTARFAAECGADVFALPGPWQSERSQGCHRLISEGALLIESPDALLQALGLHVALSPAQALALAANAEEERLLGALAHGPRPTDLLARESGLERGAFLRALFGLEQKAAITRLPGDLWRRATAVTSR